MDMYSIAPHCDLLCSACRCRAIEPTFFKSRQYKQLMIVSKYKVSLNDMLKESTAAFTFICTTG